MKHYVAVDIGCIECGESTNVLGIFEDKVKAEEVIKDHGARQSQNWKGVHRFKIFEIDGLNKVYRVEY